MVLSPQEVNRFDANSIEENGPIGYIFEADLGYPDAEADLGYLGLPELHNDYPLTPEKPKIN